MRIWWPVVTPAELCKCLSDETRIRIAGLLFGQGELCVCDLVDALDLPQPTVSRHLAQLKNCGLVTARRDAQWSYYRIPESLPAWAADVIEALMAPHLEKLGMPPAMVRESCRCG